MSEKVVLITGAGKRVGACVAEKLHSLGFRVIIHYHASKAPAEELMQSLNKTRKNSAAILQANLNEISEVKSLGQKALATWGRIDALVNNASSFYSTPLETATETQWNELFATNAKAPFFLAQTLTASLKQHKGAIVNMVDIHAKRPIKEHPIYCMAKAALLMMTKALAKDLAPDVQVNGIAPGVILWPDDDAMDEKTKNIILKRIPLGKTGAPEDIANAIAFLVTQTYITGHILPVDGGRLLTI